ncbi:endoribonuclease, putative [Candida dubliniensis CD36]|uniref:Diphthine--ammonia ligase n=1 Tax=Candida dubliniensis (strain CD36 / ATCC MYA-646 / CBS 7987 / NCPF 3949 / NRRL Y-17841) TaxID=573826 RepID=B9WB59_CANDC|nr:endoribonuclease, putative [Candida dubliniensis CD36]CAX43629.1 endoribonuclease, putative [Candida dubliniensis CD36]
MKFIGLISGGKDSFFNIHHCISQGHELVALGNLYPEKSDEIDSFMFQTVGHDVIDYYSQCLDVPLYRQPILGKSANQHLEYSVTENDEIEDLYKLLSKIVDAHPDAEGVSCGAILSHYQRTRVENVCDRLGLTSLTYLWQRNQYDLMKEMCESGLDARIIKVAAIGLTKNHLGKSISELFPTLIKLNQMYEVHICGEGGEFETIVLDCPFFKKKKLVITQQDIVEHSSDVFYLRIKVELADKDDTFEFKPLESLPLLEEEFEDIANSCPKADIGLAGLSIDSKRIVPKMEFTSTMSTLYISNLTSLKSTIEDQTEDIFQQLDKLLGEHNLTVNDIQHITLLLSDMSNFAKVNKLYGAVFKDIYLPPSRICIETDVESIQLSCIVLKQIQPKTGIHIRSRSYWGPQNIGPYSQSIVNTQPSYKTATLSGQIPLIPATMNISDKSIVFDSALSLQHLVRVKNLVNVKQFASIVCFISDESYVPIVRSCWDDLENKGNLVIVTVRGLPRGAKVEWGGLSLENITDLYDDYCSDSESEACDVQVSQFEKFDESCIVQVGKKGDFSVITLFTSDSDVVKSLSTFKGYRQLICHPKDYIDSRGDYLPVKTVFDHKGKNHKYAVILKIETDRIS